MHNDSSLKQTKTRFRMPYSLKIYICQEKKNQTQQWNPFLLTYFKQHFGEFCGLKRQINVMAGLAA